MRLNKGFIMTALGDETFLVPVGTASEHFRGIIRLNTTAAFIAERLKSETSASSLADELCAEYEVERAEAERDIVRIVDELRTVGAIKET